MHLPLRDGMWVELREHPTHGQVNLIRRALLRIDADREAATDVAVAYVQAYVSSWSVKNQEGHEVSLEDAENAPDDVVQAVAAAAKKLYVAKPDPKGSPPPSNSSERTVK